jgi:hypothetical protein
MNASGGGGALRAIAFATPDGSAWGAAMSDGEHWSLVLSRADAAPAPDGPLRVTEEPDGVWRLECGAASPDGSVALAASPVEPPVPAPSGGEADGRSDAELAGAAFVPGEGPELCRVSGTVSRRAVECPGVRVALPPPGSGKEAPGSARFVAGWLADGSGVGLIAVRPRRSDRQDADAVRATLFDPERWLAVSDPRLSTTYDGSGVPTRVNLELWVGDGEHEFPRRAAGEASGAPSAETGAGAALQALPLRCHSRGEEGVGLYVLATF